MTMVQWAKKNSRALGKVALYATGGVLIGLPVVRAAHHLYDGQSVYDSTTNSIYESYGYIVDTGTLDKTKLRTGIMATGLGALAIFAARKI